MADLKFLGLLCPISGSTTAIIHDYQTRFLGCGVHNCLKTKSKLCSERKKPLCIVSFYVTIGNMFDLHFKAKRQNIQTFCFITKKICLSETSITLKTITTSMYSSRMRTARLLTVSGGGEESAFRRRVCLLEGRVCLPEGDLPFGGVCIPEGVLPSRGRLHCGKAVTPPSCGQID